MSDYAAEIIVSICSGLGEEMMAAFFFADDILYARIFDGEKYVFPLPFMLTDDADIKGACLDISRYAVREMIPFIMSDIPREELPLITELFRHVDAVCYEDDDDSFFVKINNECDMLDSFPEISVDGITLDEITDSDKEVYAALCNDSELNKYWGYDARVDNPDGDADAYLSTVRREFDEGVAITLAVRSSGELAGEAVIYAFDFTGGAEIAVRILPSYHGRGLGSTATRALISLARQIGLTRLRAQIMNENAPSVKMTSKYMDVESADNCKTVFTLLL